MSAYVRRPSGGGGGGPTPVTDDEEDLLVLRSRQCPHFSYLPSGGAAVAAILYRHANPPLPAGASDADRRRGIVFHGDSMMRQHFLRIIASVRNDAFPLDRYFKSNALYTVTASGDEFLLFSPEELVNYKGGPFSRQQRPSSGSSPFSRRLRILAILDEWFPGYIDGFLADEGHNAGGIGQGNDSLRALWRSLVAADARAALWPNGTATSSAAANVDGASPTFAEVRGLLAQVYAAAYPRDDPSGAVLFALKFLWGPHYPRAAYYVNSNAEVVNRMCHVPNASYPGCSPDGKKVLIPSHQLVRHTHLALVIGGHHYWELDPNPTVFQFTGTSAEHLRRNKGQRQIIINIPPVHLMTETARAFANSATAQWLDEESTAAAVPSANRPPRQRFLVDFASIVEASFNASVPHVPKGVTNASMSVITSMKRITDRIHFMCGWQFGGDDDVVVYNKQHHHAAGPPALPQFADPDTPFVPIHFLRCRDPINKALSQWLPQTLLRVEF